MVFLRGGASLIFPIKDSELPLQPPTTYHYNQENPHRHPRVASPRPHAECVCHTDQVFIDFIMINHHDGEIVHVTTYMYEYEYEYTGSYIRSTCLLPQTRVLEYRVHAVLRNPDTSCTRSFLAFPRTCVAYFM